jgi:REP element-mobilizing transposase RayT
MVIAHHLIWTAYGWWLPNDPRGSMSHTIRRDVLHDLGDLHYDRKRVQPAGWVVRGFYERAAVLLKHELLTIGAVEVQGIAAAMGDVIRRCRYTCYGCAIMADHVHAIIRKHRDLAEDMIAHFQEASAAALRAAGLRPVDHPVWGGPGWKVFLDDPDDVWRTIPYVEQNPAKMGQPVQCWAFVKPYDNWPFHKRETAKRPR